MGTATARKPFTGTFLYPGVSLNNCLYTKELIGRAVERMQARIADPDGLPITMRTHHAAGDNSHLIVATVLRATQEPDGSARYEARWYDTAPARDIAALVQPPDGGPPGLKSVSIHGYFLGETSMVDVDGKPAMTGQDLEIDSIDFTATPGVVQALIDAPGSQRPPTESAPATAGRTPIAETWEVPVATVVTEEVPAEAPGADEAYSSKQMDDMADKGQAMLNDKGDPSYPIKTKADLRKAIKAVGRGGADHDKIRKHVMDRAKALGLTSLIPDTWNADGSLKESAVRFGEIRECYTEPSGAGFAIDAYNGPLSITMRAPSLSPADLRAIATAAVIAACDALQALDPDMDADIDVPGAPAEDTDRDIDPAEPGDEEDPDMADDPQPGSGCPCGCGCSVPHQMAGGPGCPCPCNDCDVCNSTQTPANETAPTPTPQLSTPDPVVEPVPTVKESAVTDVVTPAAETAAPVTPTPTTAQAVGPLMVTLTDEQFAQFLQRSVPAAPVAEAAPAAAAGPVAPVAPGAPVAQEAAPVAAAAPVEETYTKAQVDEAINAAMKDAIPQLLAAYGLPPRTGHRTTESDTPDAKPQTGAEMWDDRADLLLGSFGKLPV